MNLKNLQFIFKPSYWIMVSPYNAEVDKIVNELLDKYEPSDIGNNGCTCRLGDATIWVENRPYASGSLMGTELAEFRPSRLTIQRLLKKFYKLQDSAIRKEVARVRSKFGLNSL